MPYEELTVPYLRSKEYSSSLGEQTLYGRSSNYNSYLTSYDSDGLKINGLLTIPTTQMPDGGYPAIVFVHGYIPPTQYVTTEKYVDYVDYLARNGYVVFKIDLRGHGQSEGEAGGGYYGSDYVIDTLNARAALQNDSNVNPQKIGLWGHSMAGNATLRAMVAQPDIPAVAIWGGAVYSYEDQRKYGIQDNSYSPPANNVQRQNRRRDLYEKVGSPSAQSVFWRQVAPIYYLNDLKGAVGLFHAVNDDVVNIGYSRDLVSELSKTSVPHELNEYPSGGHNIDGSNFISAMQDTVEFYDKYLKE
jgi:dipeptidyl aminopeptidase/acylaminoacyl peptidase